MEPLLIRVYERQQLVFHEEFCGPLELGRQSRRDDGLYSLKLIDGQWRLVIAPVEEATVSRKHVRIEPVAEGKVRVKNLAKVPLVLSDNCTLRPNDVNEVGLPFTLALNRRTIRILTEADEVFLQDLGEATRPPRSLLEASSPLGSIALPAGNDPAAVLRWLQVTMEILQSASSSSDFLDQAAQAVIDLLGLDSCRVLMLKDGEWRPETVKVAPHLRHEPQRPPSTRLLNKVRTEKKTFWQAPNPSALTGGSIAGVKAVVAAPILNREGEVVGALYGDRRHESQLVPAPGIGRLDATLVELLACGVAAGLARVQQEKEILRARVQFEQFFTPELSRLLATRPDLLEGQEAEVTILFCDICGFSRISRHLGPTRTFEWVRDVMAVLSECVLEQHGVLVDYIGDELMTMWGAPEKQPGHANLASRAALAMLDRLPELNGRWEASLGEPMALGIGINTGAARVGNTGSHRKFKYGPLGPTVNLASRVQGVTRYLKAPLLVTAATRNQLDADLPARKIGKVRVVNIDEPVYLYELAPAGRVDWALLKKEYENGLEEFEHGRFRAAARILGPLVMEHPGDGPTLILLARAVNCMVEEPVAFDGTLLKLSEK